MTQLHYWQYIPQLEVLLGGRTAYQDASCLQRFGISVTLQGIHSTVIGVGRNASVIQPPSEVHMRVCDTVAKRPFLPLTLCCHITPKDN